MNVVLVGPGAFGKKHLESIALIDEVTCVALVGDDLAATRAVAQQFEIDEATTDLDGVLARPDIDAAVVCSPTPLHAQHALACLSAGKHVQVEIPLAACRADALAVVRKQHQTGLVAMCGHTRRFNPSHQWIKKRIAAGDLTIQQMNVQTYFFRRENINAAGEPRSWTDHLLWHHAAHTVDLFQYQTGEPVVQVQAIAGPRDPTLGIAMDMGIQLKAAGGAICTLSLSFNNDGPLGTVFRYICDNGTFVARYDDLEDGDGRAVDVSGVAVSTNGIELQDREFFSAIADGREPNASVQQVLSCYDILHQAAEQLRGG